MLLPHPEKALPLKINLRLVESLEAAGGPLYRMAEQLIAGDFPVARAVKILHAAYGAAESAMSPEELGDWLIEKGPPPAALLADLLAEILDPLHRLGAVKDVPAGEGGTARPA